MPQQIGRQSLSNLSSNFSNRLLLRKKRFERLKKKRIVNPPKLQRRPRRKRSDVLRSKKLRLVLKRKRKPGNEKNLKLVQEKRNCYDDLQKSRQNVKDSLLRL